MKDKMQEIGQSQKDYFTGKQRLYSCAYALKDFSDEAVESGVVGEMVELIEILSGNRLYMYEFKNLKVKAKSILAKLEGNDEKV